MYILHLGGYQFHRARTDVLRWVFECDGHEVEVMRRPDGLWMYRHYIEPVQSFSDDMIEASSGVSEKLGGIEIFVQGRVHSRIVAL